MNIQNIRDPEDYPEKLKFSLEQITINEVPKVVGSTAYLQHKYPSDVDVFENVTVTRNREDAALFYSKQLQNIVQKININDKLYFIDFKIGEDPRYKFDITNTTETERKSITYNLYRNKLIDEDDYVKLMKHTSLNDIQKFNMILRKYKVLRWSPSEVLSGRKILRKNVFITLNDAINQNTLIKLDVVTWITSRYLSIEVFFDLKYIEDDTIKAFHPLESYRESLLTAIQYYSMKENYNPLKVAKRLWSLSRIIDCSSLMEAINPLLRSDPAALNQVVADIETITLMLKNKYNNHYSKIDIDRMFLQMLGFQKRISNHSNDTALIETITQKLYNIWNDYNITYNNVKEDEVKELILLSELRCYIDEIISLLNVLDVNLRSKIFDQSKEYIEELQNKDIVCTLDRNTSISSRNLQIKS